jgi:ADP-ribose pyrophosphatase YjhB (NUDIX family)
LNEVARVIRLRRPAVLSVADGPFVPKGVDLDVVDRRWRALCAGNPAYFDGRLLHVLGVHRNGHGGAVLHVVDCAYRFYAVQDEGLDLGVRSLGVKGLTRRDDRLLLGRRSRQVAAYQGCWEFAPGGAAEPGRDPAEIVRTELFEEAALSCRGEPVPVAVLFDPAPRTWELVFQLEAGDEPERPNPREYDELRWCTIDALPEPLAPVARRMVPLAGD